MQLQRPTLSHKSKQSSKKRAVLKLRSSQLSCRKDIELWRLQLLMEKARGLLMYLEIDKQNFTAVLPTYSEWSWQTTFVLWVSGYLENTSEGSCWPVIQCRGYTLRYPVTREVSFIIIPTSVACFGQWEAVSTQHLSHAEPPPKVQLYVLMIVLEVCYLRD